MTLLSFIAPEAKAAAQTHNRLAELERQLQHIEHLQSTALLSSLKDHRFFNKSLGRDFRILFSKHVFQEYTIICAFAFLSRGDDSYDRTWLNINQGGGDVLHRELSNKLNSLFLERIREFATSPELPTIPTPSDTEHGWLYPTLGHDSDSIVVLESAAWVNAQSRDYFLHRRAALYRCLQTRLYNAVANFPHSYAGWRVPTNVIGQLQCEDFYLYLQYIPEEKLVLLLDLTPCNAEKNKDFHASCAEKSREELLKLGQRAYPLDILLLEETDFTAIQEDREGNFALSPEESDVLKHATTNPAPFPLFINGSAGSGKSTILHYLLKNYLYQAINDYENAQSLTPLYLTYSKKLQEAAIAHSEKLLKGNADIAMHKEDSDWQERYQKHQKEVFSKTFHIFQDFIRNLLSKESQADFPAAKRLGYLLFRKHWQNLAQNPQLRRYGVDLSWHIIRTYIKGMAPGRGSYFTPEDYQNLPRRQKSIADSIFAEVYQRIFLDWYQPLCENHRYWDDQDLALAVLEEVTFPTLYPAIFCDEAQDFTAIELKILYQLSLFSQRTLPAHDIGRVPFIFAGDPLQTLNPTGFRWDAVKASFHNYLLEPISRSNRQTNTAPIQIHYQELAANYRSSKAIVQFCNFIQLLRLCLFPDLYGIRPQVAWRGEGGQAPLRFSLQHPNSETLLREHNVVIIPNCHEEEENSYVLADEWLQRTVQRDDKDTPINVLSPNLSKGLEYDELVILYRFGDTCPESLRRYLEEPRHTPTAAETTEWEYFFNRLYVAASRARGKLVIFEAKQERSSFWNLLTRHDIEQLNAHFQANLDLSLWNGAQVAHPLEGDANDLSKLLNDQRFNADNIEFAEKFENLGRNSQNPSLLRRARMLFENAGNTSRAKACYALALALEGKTLAAAKLYIELHQWADALDCLWQGKEFIEISQTPWPELEGGDLRVFLAQQIEMIKNQILWRPDIVQTRRALERLQAAFDEESIDFEATGWQGIVKLLLAFLERTQEGESVKGQWHIVEALGQKIALTPERFGTVAYRLKKYRKAVQFWEQAGKTEHQDYWQSAYETVPWPDNSVYLKKLGNSEKIIQDWKDNDNNLLALQRNPDAAFALLDALLYQPQGIQQAFSLFLNSLTLENHPDRTALLKRFWEKRQALNLEPGQGLTLAQAYLSGLIERNDWSGLFTLLADAPQWTQIELIENKKFIRFFIEKLALTTRPIELAVRQQLSDWLKRTFFNSEEGWLLVLKEGIAVSHFGRALERANALEDILSYYDWLSHLPRLKSEEKKFFRARWLIAKEKQLLWLEKTHGREVSADLRNLARDKSQLPADYTQEDFSVEHYPSTGLFPKYIIDLYQENLRVVTQETETINDTDSHYRALQAQDPAQSFEAWREQLRAYIQHLAAAHQWTLLSEEFMSLQALQKHFPTLTEEHMPSIGDDILKVAIPVLAFNQEISKRKVEVKQHWTHLMLVRLRPRPWQNQWRNIFNLGLSLKEVGAAFERLGSYMDSAVFYEWALKESRNEKTQRDFAERLYVVYQRHANYLAQKEREEEAEKKAQEATALVEQYHFDPMHLPLYPEREV
jgi:hypothetical protein